MARKPLSQSRREGRQFEAQVAAELENQSLSFTPHEEWFKDPDFTLSNGLIIEVKKRFRDYNPRYTVWVSKVNWEKAQNTNTIYLQQYNNGICTTVHVEEIDDSQVTLAPAHLDQNPLRSVQLPPEPFKRHKDLETAVSYIKEHYYHSSTNEDTNDTKGELL